VSPPLRVGVIGAGAIANGLLEYAAASDAFAITTSIARTSALGDVPRAASVDELLAAADVVVEAAGKEALAQYGPEVLARGVDLVAVSVGALADAGLRERLLAAAGPSKLLVASGAVGALDVLTAAHSVGALESVEVEQRKPPRALLPAAEADALRAPTLLYEGPAAEACARFPKTTNISAAVSLAGLGFERTRVRVVADPTLTANVVELKAAGAFGSCSFSLTNVASANPRTSAIVAQSIVATLLRLASPIVVPA
jgi:aspartate dehydrogenase